MKRIALSGPHARFRAQRWDVVVLGSALPGLIAAARLAMGRLRVLVVSDAAERRRPPILRDPFFLAGGCSGGVLDTCLRELALPLIDRRRLVPEPTAYQIVLPDARIGIGTPALTADELVAWRLVKPELARTLVKELLEAGAAELSGLLETSAVRVGGLRNLMRGRAPGRLPRYARGLPAEVADPGSPLAPLFDAQLRVLLNVARASCPPEARARLLGSALEGGCGFADDEVTLHGLLEKRLDTLHGEMRSLSDRFELVHAENQPGLVNLSSGEVWLGRALILNVPLSRLSSWMESCDVEVPRFVARESKGVRRRHSLLLRVPSDVLPEGMGRRVIRVLDPEQELDGANVIALSVVPAAQGDFHHLIASTVLSEMDELRAAESRMMEAVAGLMPFAEERVERVAVPKPSAWDDPTTLEDPGAASGWPGQSELRLSARPPVYRLAREDLGVLGLEGDVLLGWQAGDAIRQEFS